MCHGSSRKGFCIILSSRTGSCRCREVHDIRLPIRITLSERDGPPSRALSSSSCHVDSQTGVKSERWHRSATRRCGNRKCGGNYGPFAIAIFWLCWHRLENVGVESGSPGFPSQRRQGSVRVKMCRCVCGCGDMEQSRPESACWEAGEGQGELQRNPRCVRGQTTYLFLLVLRKRCNRCCVESSSLQESTRNRCSD
jgi:hypothetical protein